MKIIALAIGLGLFITTSAAYAGLLVEGCDFGEVYAFSEASCELAFHNASEVPVSVRLSNADTKGDTVTPETLTVEPKSDAYMHAVIRTGEFSGSKHHIFHLMTDEQGQELRTADAHGFVMSVLDESKPALDLGTTVTSDLPSEQYLKLASSESPQFRIARVIEKPSYVDVRILPDAQTLGVKLAKGSDWGIKADYIRLAIDSPQQHEAWVSVKADIRGDIMPASNPFNLGVVRVGNGNIFKIPLRSRSGKDFDVGQVKLNDMSGDVSVDRCIPAVTGCRSLSLKLPKVLNQGALQGSITVELPQYGRQLRIAVWGLILDKDAKIKSFDELNQSSKQLTQSPISKGGAAVDIAHALDSAVHDEAEIAPSGYGPLLKWAVTNDDAIHGYQIFRSENESGPFMLLNTPSVKSKPLKNVTANYQYRDNTAQSGRTYWYYIGLLYNDGHKQQLTGPQKVVAK